MSFRVVGLRVFVPYSASRAAGKKSAHGFKTSAIQRDMIMLPINASATTAETPSLTQRKIVHHKDESDVKFYKDAHGNLYAPAKHFPKTDPNYVPAHIQQDKSLKNIFVSQVKSLKQIELPKGVPQVPMAGSVKKVTLGTSTHNVECLGFDYKERAIVHDVNAPEAQQRILDNVQTKSLIPLSDEFQTCLATLPKDSHIYYVTPKFRSLMEHALTRPIVGTTSGMHYIEWLRDSGGTEAYVLGGAVRDLIQASLENPSITSKEAAEIVNDIDVSAVGTTITAQKMLLGVHGSDLSSFDIAVMPEYGGLHIKKGGGAGFDFNSMMIGTGTYDEPAVHPDRSEEGPLVPAIFGGKPHRNTEALDFCCNTLLYDPINGIIIDPTGRGVEDAKNRFLRLTGTEMLRETPQRTLAFKQPAMFQRFWKFRFRGYQSNSYTTLTFQQAAVNRWAKIADDRFYNDIARMLPLNKLSGNEAEQRKQINHMLDKLEQVMKEDDKVSGQHFELFQKRVEPKRKEIVEFIIQEKMRQKKA